jgi:hypothetical protein
MKNTNIKKFAALALLSSLAALAAGAATASESHWAQNHPRRDQVNDRLEHQDRRINQEVKEGKITKSQAAQLHKEDHQIRQEERLMASQNGGHITKQEQRTLNQQENAVSRQIGR